MNKTKKRKIGVIMIILLLLSVYIMPFLNVVNAYSVSQAYIYPVKDSEYHLQFWTGSTWSYVITSYVGYTGEDGKFYPAYCVNRELPRSRIRKWVFSNSNRSYTRSRSMESII